MSTHAVSYVTIGPLPNVTSGEKLILPMFFQSNREGIAFGPMLEANSTLQYLMDEWKEEAVMQRHKEAISLIKCLKDRIQAIKQFVILDAQFRNKALKNQLQTFLNSTQVYDLRESMLVQKHQRSLDTKLRHAIYIYYAILEEKKRLYAAKHNFIRRELAVKEKLASLVYRLQMFATHIKFESHNAIKLRRIDQSQSQYQRCERAVRDNIHPNYFQDSNYHSLRLREAFKVENSLLLKPFEEKLCNTKGAILKGLFCSVSEEQLEYMVVYGTSEKSPSEYQREVMRVPPGILGKHRSRVASALKRSQSFDLPFEASSYCTLPQDSAKIMNLDPDDDNLFYVVLCRVIVSRGSSSRDNDANLPKDVVYDSKREIYTVSNDNIVYPEYILICQLESKDPLLLEDSRNDRILKVDLRTPQLQIHNDIVLENLETEGKNRADQLDKHHPDYVYHLFELCVRNAELQKDIVKSQLNQYFQQFWKDVRQEMRQSLQDVTFRRNNAIIEELKNVIDQEKLVLRGRRRHTKDLKHVAVIRNVDLSNLFHESQS
eukprot:CAMPEP_0115003520 /NCGR_PEP_ID=MMETSP0216-20121206/18663_1 /TAXON_ID=223996 /ORGANISM="Protocruzia adherens, Strain Boccale" /LENGTH=544 /DNA_ID=CAMNT_0002369347 /DNA_START=70 /DNA_END=1704 /DNA_ORIENTATION=+